METKIEEDTCIPLFIAALFTIARTWKPILDAHRQMNGKSCGTYTQWILLSHKKECIRVSSDEVDEPRTYYTQ